LKTRAVLFDMGGTLVFATCSESETFRRILRSVGVARTKRDIEEALSKTKKELDAEGFAEEFGKIPREEFWVRRDSCVLKHLGIGDRKGELARVLDRRWFDFANFKSYSDTQKTLERLRETGLRTGLISNGYEEEIRSVLSKAGLSTKMFDVVVGADTVHERKPHRDIFAYALRKLQVRPEEAIFVGDRIDTDYKGAEEAGIRSLLVLREKTGTELKETRTISRLSEIFNLI